MVIFLLTFGIASLFNYVADQYYNRNKKVTALCAILSIVVVSALAGVRDLTVGTDVQVYVQPEVLRVLNGWSLPDLLVYHGTSSPLFWIYTYIMTNLFRDVHWVLFSIEFFICALFYSNAFHCKKEHGTSLALSMFVFYCLFYIETYNTMKQCMAMAVIVFGMRFLERDDWKKYIICLVIAIAFHPTAFLGAIIPFMYIITRRKKFAPLYIFILTIGSFAAMFLYEQILNFLMSVGLLTDHYDIYLGKYLRDSFTISFPLLALNLALIAFYLIMWSIIEREYKNSYALMFMALFGNVMYILNGVIQFGYRAGLYFDIYPQTLFLSVSPRAFAKSSKWAGIFLVLLFLTVYFIYKLVYNGWAGVYPYTSSILGIG